VAKQPPGEQHEHDGKAECDSPKESADRHFFHEPNPVNGGHEPFDDTADNREDDEKERETVAAIVFLDLVRQEQAERCTRRVGERHPDYNEEVRPWRTLWTHRCPRKRPSGGSFPRVSRFRARRSSHGLRLPASNPQIGVRHP